MVQGNEQLRLKAAGPGWVAGATQIESVRESQPAVTVEQVVALTVVT